MQATRLLLLFSVLIMSINSFGGPVQSYNSHEPTAQELKKVYDDFRLLPKKNTLTEPVTTPAWQPVFDTADFRYVLLSSEADFDEAAQLRYKIAENLPDKVKLVLLVTAANVERVKKAYAPYIAADRLILAKDASIAGGFWARDAFPYPVITSEGALSLVGAHYYRPFRSSQALADSLHLRLTQNNFTFVGGNLIADEFGTCFTIDSYRRFTTTENDLRSVYGCREVHILKHEAGIGDVDEVMKPLGNKVILTNIAAYADDFKAWGYQVVMLPFIPNSYRTYANSLIVGKTVFMPIFGVATDLQAQQVYESLGYKVVGIRTNSLSDDQHGSIHCQSMAYPNINEGDLLQLLQLDKIN